MNFDLPIQQLVKRTGTRSQLGFANEAKARVRARDDFLLYATRRGLRVLGRKEESLCAPIAALRQTYGPSLAVQEPKVRLIKGKQVLEPVMHVRVSLETAYRGAVKAALLARGATAAAEHTRTRLAVLIYEAPLARLMGLAVELARITSGTARCWIVLSHYVSLKPDPGGRAA